MDLPKRKPTRLKGYDYSTPGAYFVTLCTQNRENLFETEPVGNDVMRWFKTMVTNEYIRMVKDGRCMPFDKKIWQKSFHDHIIRSEKDYRKTWEYIDTNSLNWDKDCFYNEGL